MSTKKMIEYLGSSGAHLCTIPKNAIKECAHSGPCDVDVAEWLPKVKDWAIDGELCAELKEYGAWEDLDEADTETIRSRILWVACGNIAEDPRCYGVRFK